MDRNPAAELLQIAGLPLHPLLVHAVVVLAPLTVLALLLGAFWPAARRRLGIVTPLGALVVLALVPITVAAGESLEQVVGAAAVAQHARLGRMLLPWAIALFAAAAAQWVWYRFARVPVCRAARAVAVIADVGLAMAAVVVGTGTVLLLVLIGDSGARAVWGSFVP